MESQLKYVLTVMLLTQRSAPGSYYVSDQEKDEKQGKGVVKGQMGRSSTSSMRSNSSAKHQVPSRERLHHLKVFNKVQHFRPIGDFGEEYVADENFCKGWCKEKVFVNYALNFFMDVSLVHEGLTVGLEKAVGL